MGEMRSATGMAIRFARERLGWTQETLAGRARVAEAHLSKIERGLADPSVTVLARLAKGLGMTLAELSAEIEAERKRANP